MPTVNTLTDNNCRMAKPTGKPYKLFDGHGLHLHVSAQGAKVWRVAYRYDGKAQTHTIGHYPLVTLAEARSRRDSEVRRFLLEGMSPKTVGPKAKAPTFQEASETYWSGRLDISDAYRLNAQNALNQHLEPRIGSLPIDQVGRDELLAALLEIDKAGKLVYVRTVRGWASQVFDWAIERGHCVTNPATQIKPQKAFRVPAKESHAAVKVSEVAQLMHRLSVEAELQSVLACKFLALTWVRTKEMRVMSWDQLEGPVDEWTMWRIPKQVMKKRVEHLVPLSHQAVAILRAMRFRSRGSKYVFPAEHTIQRPMSENAVLYLLHRIGYKGRMTGHGWRSVGSSWANETGFNPDAVERQLAHMPSDEVRAACCRRSKTDQLNKEVPIQN